MNNTQNAKIAQVTNDTMVIGIDIGSQKHWARAFDNRGMELSKKAFGFSNTAAGFASFEVWYEGHSRAEKNHGWPGTYRALLVQSESVSVREWGQGGSGSPAARQAQ